jgi:hypothetical protein
MKDRHPDSLFPATAQQLLSVRTSSFSSLSSAKMALRNYMSSETGRNAAMTALRLEKLKEQERQLVARRKALEARMRTERKRRSVRQLVAIGSALLTWMRADDMARKALPVRLGRFINENDRALVEAAFREVEVSNFGTEADERKGSGDAQT